MRPFLYILVLLSLGACERVERLSVSRGEPACLEGEDRLRVRFAACLSSSCDSLVSAHCSVSVEGTEAQVTGTAQIDHLLQTACTEDCGLIEAVCPESLGSATHIRFGPETRERAALEPCSR